MKRLTYPLVAWLIFLAACKKTDSVNQTIEPEQANRSCATQQVVEAQMAADPGYRSRLAALNEFTRRMIATGELSRVTAGKTIEIPVVVHVIYANNQENISNAQIQSQIDVLNEDFNLKNADSRQIPNIFTSVKADVGLKFVLADVTRTYNPKSSWPANNSMKSTAHGGSDPVDPAHNLNIWVCDISKYLGYAYYPGAPASIDGVVISTWAFGSIGTLYAAYNKGRTATHEVGHWMNLIHIWGDANCGSDEVDDTPQHNAANFGCPDYPHLSTCTGTPVEMTMNYMDYTDDACMFMFSKGQKDRMLAVFAPGGPRASFVN